MVQTNSYGHNFFLVLQVKREITTICIRVHIIKGGTLIFCLSISMNINFQQFFQGKPVYLTEFIQWNLKEHEEIENTEDIFIILPPRLYQPKIFQAFSCPSSQLSSPPTISPTNGPDPKCHPPISVFRREAAPRYSRTLCLVLISS